MLLKGSQTFPDAFKPRPRSPSSLQLLKRLHSSSSRRSRDGGRQTDLTAKTHLIDIGYRMIHSILIPVYQCLSAVQMRFRSSFRSVSAFPHLGCSKNFPFESSHLNQPQSSIQSFHVAKSGHIGSYGFSWWIQRCCFDEALHFNTSWWALDHGGGRKDEFWWYMYGLPYDVWWCM